MESTEPGVARPRFSITSADREHCTVAKPVLRPRLPASRLRGKPYDMVGSMRRARRGRLARLTRLVGKDDVARTLRAALRTVEHAQKIACDAPLARMRTRPV